MHGKKNQMKEIASQLYGASKMHAEQAQRIEKLAHMGSMGPAIVLELGGFDEDDQYMMDMDMDRDPPEELLEIGKDLLCKANEIYEQLPHDMRRKMDKHIKAKEEQRMGYNRNHKRANLKGE